MLPPERQEAGVHFRRHGSGHAARRNFRGPESLVAGLVIQMFDNGEAVPHHCLTVPKDRHLAGRRGEFVPLTAFVPILIIKGNDSLFEQQSRLRSEEHTSELQSLMRISYAVFCLKKKTHKAI